MICQPITRCQRKAVKALWIRHGNGDTYKQFRRKFSFGISWAYIGIQIKDTYYGIEPDGHTHT